MEFTRPFYYRICFGISDWVLILSFKKKILFAGNWGLKLDKETMNIQGRTLDPEMLIFGRNYKELVNAKADWGQFTT